MSPRSGTTGTSTSGPTAAWATSQHDTIPLMDFFLLQSEAHIYLAAFLTAEGEPFHPPYSAVRASIEELVAARKERERIGQPPSAEVADQRLRTWKKTFEDYGVLLVEADGSLHLTPLGRALRDLRNELDREIDGANDRLAKLAVSVLSRHTLANPLDTASYPSDTDVFPYRLIWRAMRALSGRLHWEELNRVLMHVTRRANEASAIEHIRSLRPASGSYTAENLLALGQPALEDGPETKRRITPWFTRAGFGGLLIGAYDDTDGFRQLVAKHIPLIDHALSTDLVPTPDALLSRASYLQYLSAGIALNEPKTAYTANDTAVITNVTEAVERYGGHKSIVLSGIPATGKTRIARAAAMALVDGEDYRFMEIQFHEGTTYEDFIEGFIPRPGGDGFELVPKALRILNRRAVLDPSRRYVLLIEEFTRANVHAVLGELLTYIEHRGRRFRLTLSQEEMWIAPNLVVLATMNPRDRSAMTLDNAVLRRLFHVTVASSTTALREMLAPAMPAELLAPLAFWFDKYRDVLPFGHGVFAGCASQKDLQDIWGGSLRPFLQGPDGTLQAQFGTAAAEYPWITPA